MEAREAQVVVRDGGGTSELFVSAKVFHQLRVLPGDVVVVSDSNRSREAYARIWPKQDMPPSVADVGRFLLSHLGVAVGKAVVISLPQQPVACASRVVVAAGCVVDRRGLQWQWRGMPVWSGGSMLCALDGRRVAVRVVRVEPQSIGIVGSLTEIIEEGEKEASDDVAMSKTTLVGVDGLMQRAVAGIQWALSGREGAPHGILVSGPPGGGKTALIMAAGAKLGCAVEKAVGREGGFVGAAGEAVREAGRKARQRSPCILVIEEGEGLLDEADGDDETGEDDRLGAGVAALMGLLDALQQSKEKVAIAVLTTRPDRLPRALRRAGRLEVEVEVGPLDRASRAAILARIIGEDAVPEGLQMPGMVAGDVVALGQEALLLARAARGGKVEREDVLQAMKRVQTGGTRGWEIDIPDVGLEQACGMEEVKQRLLECIEWPIRHADAFSRLGVKPASGVLLYGPPGNGKTLIARAVASRFSCSFIVVKGPELYSKYVGESERALDKVFAQARLQHPCVIFLDEIDALAPRRGASSGQVTDRMLSTLLSQLDGVSPLRGVTVIAATNRPDHLDPALLRPGRLSHLLYVPLPDAKSRGDLMKGLLMHVPRGPSLADEASIVQFAADKCEGCSGAECAAIVKEAKLAALSREGDAPQVGIEDLEHGLLQCPPRTPKETIEFFERWKP